MGFNFTFFGEGEHRVFNYKPRYYDPRKEERREMFSKVDGQADQVREGEQDSDTYKAGKYISGSFRDGNYQKLRKTGKAQRILGIVGLVLFFVILFYIARFYTLLLQ